MRCFSWSVINTCTGVSMTDIPFYFVTDSPVQCPPMKQLVKSESETGEENEADQSEAGDERKLDNLQILSQQDQQIRALPGIDFSSDPDQVMIHIEDKVTHTYTFTRIFKCIPIS